MTAIRDEACIVGLGETEYRRWGGFQDRSELQLTCEAIQAAAADAGLDVDDIDGVVSYAMDRNDPAFLQDAMGLPNIRFASQAWGGGGAASCASLQHAVAAVQSGAAHYVAAFRGLCQGQSARYGKFNAARRGNNFLAPFGMFSPPIMMAPMIQRYMYEYGFKQEHLGEIALNARANAHRNPRAVMRDRPLTMETYLASRLIASPLRLYDCCQENDGACAVIVTTLERARDLKARPVRILAAAHMNTPGWGAGPVGTHNMPIEDYGAGNCASVAREVFGRAGVTPKDIDVAQIYDHFSGLVLMSLENFGFCGRGEAGDFVADGHIRWEGGDLPINTSGGHLSEAYMHGFNLILEGARQIRGESTSQVEGAEICLVTGGSGAPAPSAAILGV